MHPSFLSYLADPESKAPLRLEARRWDGERVVDGALVSPTAVYPIRAAVPRFVTPQAAAYAQSFGTQWRRWSRVQFESENRGRPMAGHTRGMWERITGIRGSLGGAIVGDFGCGAGRFLEIVREKGGRVIGLELSDAADVAGAGFFHDPDVLVCQADGLRPPIAPAVLDGAFSIGVLHHTPDPRRGVREMVHAVRDGGWIAVAVYPRGGYYDSLRVRIVRRIVRALRPAFGDAPALAYARFSAHAVRPLTRIPLLGRVLRRALPVIVVPDARWSVLDMFDSLTPAYQSTHDAGEVCEWLRSAGADDPVRGEWGPTAWHAVRRALDPR